jgi:hypothetical protein
MPTFPLVHGEAAFPVASQALKQACALFAAGAPLSRYSVKSQVPVGHFRLFLEAVKGNDIQITNENVSSLSQLCKEFGFQRLASKVSAFCGSPEHRIWVLEARLSEQEQKLQAHGCRISALEGRVSEQALRTDTQNQLAAEVEQLKVSSEEVKVKQTEQEQAIAALKALTAPRLESCVVSSFPPLFDEFRGKRFALLWRGSRDGFAAGDFHGRCDGRANTLTLILDTCGNIFGGFTPLTWESREWSGQLEDKDNRYGCDDSLKSFLFTLNNPHNISPRKFALKAEKKQYAIHRNSSRGPLFGAGHDIAVFGNCNANTDSWTSLGLAYTNDTGPYGNIVFTSSKNFQVREIEAYTFPQ